MVHPVLHVWNQAHGKREAEPEPKLVTVSGFRADLEPWVD